MQNIFEQMSEILKRGTIETDEEKKNAETIVQILIFYGHYLGSQEETEALRYFLDSVFQLAWIVETYEESKNMFLTRNNWSDSTSLYTAFSHFKKFPERWEHIKY